MTVPMMWRRCPYPLWPSASHCFAQIATTQPCQKIQVDQSVRRRRYGVEQVKSSYSLRAFRNRFQLDGLDVGIKRLSV